jgi:alpha-amylase/alpha-mannosidase (GH57 family)
MLHVTFVWHFHQPSYWDPIRQTETMPWARMHSIKGYCDMADALERHPDVRANINLVPSLIDRWVDLSESEFNDEYYRVAMVPADELSPVQKEFLILRFFQANWDTMIQPHPRYHQLLVKRGHQLTPELIRRAVDGFTTEDFRDLQVWFDLSWFGYSAVERFEELQELRRRDREFREEDKWTIWQIQRQIISELVPRYRRLWEQGQIEVTTTPYFHPILPLLIDSECAREGLSNAPMPSERFQAPDDARFHLERARARVSEVLGREPEGLWPAEGSVSMDMLQMAAECGFGWAASDEEVLIKTLGKPRSAKELYRPYLLDVEPPISMVFRDHGLSDSIGFRYSRMPAKQAAKEFLEYLGRIDRGWKSEDGAPLVSVILDGENAWEYFRDSGREFLDCIYGGLESRSKFRTVTVGEFLADNPPKEHLTSIFPGTWIMGNFRVWVGDLQKNRAWDLLSRTRRFLVGSDGERNTAAWEALYRAEGSDWFWWYGDIHSSDNDSEFDRLFRNNLRFIYRSLGKDVPPEIDRPISRIPWSDRRVQPAFAMTPVLDGKVTSYYEWVGACEFNICRAGGTMGLPDARAQRIYYGFDEQNLYLRVDFREGGETDLQAIQFYFNGTPNNLLAIDRNAEGSGVLAAKGEDGGWQDRGSCGHFSWQDVLEVDVPFQCLGVDPGKELGFYLQVIQQGNVVERWPLDGVIQFVVPRAEDFLANWCV